jgi:hypothetical protein
MSLADRRDDDGALEVGVVLLAPASKMACCLLLAPASNVYALYGWFRGAIRV